MRQNDAFIIDRQTPRAAKLARLIDLAFFDGGYFRFMQGVQSLSGFFAIENFTALIDHLLAHRYQLVKVASGLFVFSGIQRV